MSLVTFSTGESLISTDEDEHSAAVPRRGSSFIQRAKSTLRSLLNLESIPNYDREWHQQKLEDCTNLLTNIPLFSNSKLKDLETGPEPFGVSNIDVDYFPVNVANIIANFVVPKVTKNECVS